MIFSSNASPYLPFQQSNNIKTSKMVRKKILNICEKIFLNIFYGVSMKVCKEGDRGQIVKIKIIVEWRNIPENLF